MRTRHELRVTPGELATLSAPRDDLVGESPPQSPEDATCDLLFEQADGPFVHYRRKLTVLTEEPDGSEDTDEVMGTVLVRQDFEYRLPPMTWKFLTYPLIAQGLKRSALSGRTPWWAPTQRIDPRAASILGLLAALTAAVSYVASLPSFTMTFVAEEFGASNTAQATVFSAARLGGVLAVGMTLLADRRGRTRVLVASMHLSIAITVVSAATPSLLGFGVAQAVSRGATTATAALVIVILAEEMPKGARAWGISQVTMAGAIGSGAVLALLPLADLGLQAWRFLYAAPVVLVPLVIFMARRLPETQRFVRPHKEVSIESHRSRLWLIAGVSLLLNVLMSPVSQFRNEFLRDERAFSASTISLFVVVTGGLAGIGIIVGGRLSEAWGRRVVGAGAAVGGGVFLALMFNVTGPAMWVVGSVGMILIAALVPSTSMYGAELFPTSLRGRANGIVGALAMVGSVVGLQIAGRLADETGSFALPIALLAIGPLIAAVLILTRFPETADHELEDLNPEDQPSPSAAAPDSESSSPSGAGSSDTLSSSASTKP